MTEVTCERCILVVVRSNGSDDAGASACNGRALERHDVAGPVYASKYLPTGCFNILEIGSVKEMLSEYSPVHVTMFTTVRQSNNIGCRKVSNQILRRFYLYLNPTSFTDFHPINPV